ncbi:hypothetical protein EEB18_021840 [Sphingopyxis sp. OPL5]|uniref:hypothetical protein n=1 Tax=unclassified Sphingopyxis TaxID=2614943 RepID=UPI000A823077|nr:MULTISPECIES: hypothetical protein [unclassified Sphingopyxis]QNO27305.1 hypothetical protein EEB18_021840 [Sphingopyxis sp. OPL5]
MSTPANFNGARPVIDPDDAAEWAQVNTKIFPPYQLRIECYAKAQQVANDR